MIIDTHCHVWSFDVVEYHNKKTVHDYLRDHKIDKISMIAMNNIENVKVQKIVQAEPDKFFGFAYVDPRNIASGIAILEEGVRAGYFRGVKMYPYFEHYNPDSRSLYPLYEACLRLDIPLLFHMGWINIDIDASNARKGRYAHTGFPAEIGTVLEDFPCLKMILAHLGGNYYYECLTMAERFPNVYLETAWLQFYSVRFFPPVEIGRWITHACSFIGSEKIIFGGEGVYPEDIEATPLSFAQKANILGLNAQRLLKL